uniref:Pancreatic trypsin inhibitor n=1 Tax=Rhipicephalus appendiculatus TaxID=34631 RepID=A0A131YN68_RHIAP
MLLSSCILIASVLCAAASSRRQMANDFSHAEQNTTKLDNSKKASRQCEKRPDPGLCRAYQPTWYHDRKHKACKMFIYGGCGGNANQFPSEHKCQQACLPKERQQPICSPKPTQGRCNISQHSWYFESSMATCTRYSSGLCPSGANKFQSCQKCLKTCTNLKAKETCRILMEY